MTAITSWPCFELWMLLHFRYSSAPIAKTGKKSSGDMACEELRRHVPAYQKGHKTVYEELLPKLTAAMVNARRLQKENVRTGANNPATRVHEIVDYLLKLKTPPVR
jgi:hypothetical protein